MHSCNYLQIADSFHQAQIESNKQPPGSPLRLCVCVLHHLNEDPDEVKHKRTRVAPAQLFPHIQLWGAIIPEACSVLIKSRFITLSLHPCNESGVGMIKL